MAKGKETTRLTTIVGYVEEIEEDDNIGAIIYTDDEDYIVEMNKQGRTLLDEAGSEVRVTGTVSKDKDGTKRIAVLRFEVLETEDDEDEEYDEEYEEYDDEGYDEEYDDDYGYDYSDES